MDKAVLRDLQTLIAFPTVSNRPLDELAAFLATRCEDLGFRVDAYTDARVPGKRNLVCRVGPENTEGLVLSGHMDVVPTEGQPWTSDPFKLTERDGLLYGRGTADMKGFFAATLAALKHVDLKRLKRELVLIWTHDEEVGCLGSAILADQLLAADIRLPKACIIGEPTGFEVFRMHPGHVAMVVRIRGRAAHSSRPELGINAIVRAGRAVLAIQKEADRLSLIHYDIPELPNPWVVVNVATITGGSAVNIVPDICEIHVGFRPLPDQSPHEIFELLMTAVREVVYDAEGEILRITPSMLTNASTSLVPCLLDHAGHDLCKAASFATDGGNLSKLGLQPLIFGPGHIEVAHQPDEHIDPAHLTRAEQLLTSIIRERCI